MYLEKDIEPKEGCAGNDGKHGSIFLSHCVWFLSRFLQNRKTAVIEQPGSGRWQAQRDTGWNQFHFIMGDLYYSIPFALCGGGQIWRSQWRWAKGPWGRDCHMRWPYLPECLAAEWWHLTQRRSGFLEQLLRRVRPCLLALNYCSLCGCCEENKSYFVVSSFQVPSTDSKNKILRQSGREWRVVRWNAAQRCQVPIHEDWKCKQKQITI